MMEGEILRLVRRRAALQKRLGKAEDAVAYSRVLLDIARVNRQLAVVSDQPEHRGVGFLRPVDPGQDKQPDRRGQDRQGDPTAT